MTMNKSTHKAHPAAELFPLMTKDELRTLADDIKKNGLVSPIVRTKDGVILDGRNRLAACEIAGVKPRFEEYIDKDPVAFIVSANIHRRHLTTTQKRELVGKLLKLNSEKSDRQIATAIKVDHKTVAKERRKKEARGEIPHVAKRADAKGRKQPASKPKIVKLAVTNLPAEPKVVQVEITAEQCRAANAALDAPKEDRALREFKYACDTWLPKLDREHLDEAVRYCGTFATVKAVH
jgi:ParB-like chromosome segregation protein Spo0J